MTKSTDLSVVTLVQGRRWMGLYRKEENQTILRRKTKFEHRNSGQVPALSMSKSSDVTVNRPLCWKMCLSVFLSKSPPFSTATTCFSFYCVPMSMLEKGKNYIPVWQKSTKRKLIPGKLVGSAASACKFISSWQPIMIGTSYRCLLLKSPNTE